MFFPHFLYRAPLGLMALSLSLSMVEDGTMSVDEFGRRWSQRWHTAYPSQYPYTAPIEDEDEPVLLQEAAGEGPKKTEASKLDELINGLNWPQQRVAEQRTYPTTPPAMDY